MTIYEQLKRLQEQTLERGMPFEFTGDLVDEYGQVVRKAAGETFTVELSEQDRSNIGNLATGAQVFISMGKPDQIIDFTTGQGMNVRMNTQEFLMLSLQAMQYVSTVHFTRRSILRDYNQGVTFSNIADEFHRRLNERLSKI